MILIAQGPNSADSWRKPLPASATIVLGRDSDVWNAPWEPHLSRRHVELNVKGKRVKVRRLAATMNPIYHAGKQTDSFDLLLGGSFVIGNTLFTLADASARPHSPAVPASEEAVPVEARTVRPRELDRIAFRDAPHRLDVLSRLPEVISSAADDLDLFARLGDMLLAGIRRADAVAIVTPGKVLHGDRRLAGEGGFEPSRRLISEAVEKQCQTVLHVWGAGQQEQNEEDPFTMRGGFDWAFCVPLRGESCPGWGIYVTGRFAGLASTLLAPWESNELRDDVKFAELVADILGALRQVQVLRERQGVFRRFFSPGVMNLMSGAEGRARARAARNRRHRAVLRPPRLLEDGGGGRRATCCRCSTASARRWG